MKRIIESKISLDVLEQQLFHEFSKLFPSSHKIMNEIFITAVEKNKKLIQKSEQTDLSEMELEQKENNSFIIKKFENAVWCAELFIKYFPNLFEKSDLRTIDELTRLKLIFDLNSHNAGLKSGCFPLASYFNHSCIPNATCEISVDKPCMLVRSLKAIEKNEEVCISYVFVPEEEQDSEDQKLERKKYLRRHFFFECNCPKCR